MTALDIEQGYGGRHTRLACRMEVEGIAREAAALMSALPSPPGVTLMEGDTWRLALRQKL